MTHPSEHSEATTNEREREVTFDGELDLKTTREDARRGNYHRVAHREGPPPDEPNVESETEDQTSKMERRLSKVREFTRSLSKDLNTYLILWAKRLLSCAMTNAHYEKRRTYFINNPSFTPKSIRFKYEHQTKLKLKGNKEFEALREAAKVVMCETKQKLRNIIRSTQDLEEQTTQNSIKKEFRDGLKHSFILRKKEGN